MGKVTVGARAIEEVEKENPKLNIEQFKCAGCIDTNEEPAIISLFTGKEDGVATACNCTGQIDNCITVRNTLAISNIELKLDKINNETEENPF